ncbi:SRPBCC family protein [Hoeflea ulvae]|uniref:Carbon monoxide dehydrogenase subunit G n=1 Tax=Hoeflea ulvae TaxID=2983764 RepID=A0ABT3YH67_9HYPH|nr:carbon monoxide dehydrogenase subunit G [Hoeflea ulvae]MCY0094967.1 carbon monoxide dehydrogenase subunit G [Hoeflea ulvae]
MEMNGSQRIEASREVVYAALNDVDVLRQCIPGCQSIEKTSDTEMNAKVTLRVGPVKASFAGKVTLSDLDPPNGYTISGEGSGGMAGFAKGGAKVDLVADGDDATILNYDVQAQIGGKIAQLGSRLIDGTAKKLAGDFFEKFSEIVGPQQPAEAAEPEEVAEKKGWVGRLRDLALRADEAPVGAASPAGRPRPEI